MCLPASIGLVLIGVPSGVIRAEPFLVSKSNMYAAITKDVLTAAAAGKPCTMPHAAYAPPRVPFSDCACKEREHASRQNKYGQNIKHPLQYVSHFLTLFL